MLGEKHVMINPGERVLIIGKRQGGKTSFFSAIAGLWPWGCGRILLPPAQTMMFISQQDYMPPGTLRDALAYPSQPSQFASEKYIAALERMKLAHLSPHLDRVARWEQEDLPCSRPYRLFRKVMRSTSLGVEPTRGAGPG
jgi:putative ATP-binding cassette transporter